MDIIVCLGPGYHPPCRDCPVRGHSGQALGHAQEEDHKSLPACNPVHDKETYRIISKSMLQHFVIEGTKQSSKCTVMMRKM
jgi:hypothetical protein